MPFFARLWRFRSIAGRERQAGRRHAPPFDSCRRATFGLPAHCRKREPRSPVSVEAGSFGVTAKRGVAVRPREPSHAAGMRRLLMLAEPNFGPSSMLIESGLREKTRV